MFRAQARRHADPIYIAPRLKIQGHQDSVDQAFKALFSPLDLRETSCPLGMDRLGTNSCGFQTWGIPCFDGENDDIPLNFGELYFQTKPKTCPCCGQVINELYRDHGLEIDQADSWASCVVQELVGDRLVVSDYRYNRNPEKDGKGIHHFGRNSLFYCLLRVTVYVPWIFN